MAKTKKKNVYEIITDKFIDKLKEGTIPWQKPFYSSSNVPVRWESQKAYRGVNVLLLEPNGEYASMKVIRKHKGWVKKEELKNYSISVFWLWYKLRYDEDGNLLDKKADDEEADDIQYRAKPIYHKVYEINTQVDGLESRKEDIVIEDYEHDPIDEAEELIEGYKNKPKITHKLDGAYYQPVFDFVNVPPMEKFDSIHEYYSTLFHELIHSTGHPSRLNRLDENNFNFGSHEYSKEELVAEIGSNFLASHVGFDDVVFENSASYINNWIQRLENDPKMIVQASQRAQKACDHILDMTFDEE